ncbi:MAG: membrane-bound O-acyltransferase family protein [Melioribacteraceae bacterium]|nr:MAG: membrane-bound O-acyltransferase family protein [Melioribacteraceae bacterium]
MLFYTLPFFVFLVVLISLLLVTRGENKKKLILLTGSYIFYMWWNPAFITLIILSTLIDYNLAKRIEITETQHKRKILLVLSLAANLGILGFFKYANFFQDNLFILMRLFGYEPGWSAFNIILPVGISFYTFQTMSYTIDVYNRKLKATHSPLDFAVFVSFFPQLVAGPIVRAADFLPQLAKPVKLNRDSSALFLFLRGLAKKVIIADNISIFADAVFNDPAGWNSIVIWVATFAFYIQIYCDFSGYSDMAIAVARLLGFDLMLNFDRPYFANNPSVFWKKWHISLSSWLRDYLYIPLGGNRGSVFFTYRNLTLTMLLGGLWHGASWNFVLWGALHGFLLIAHRLIVYLLSLIPENYKIKPNLITKIISIVTLQYFVLLTWIPFRLVDSDKMLYALKKFIFFDFNFSLTNLGLEAMAAFSTVALMGFFFLLHFYSEIFGGIDEKLAKSNRIVQYTALLIIGFLLVLLFPTNEAPFIYFQF